MPEGLNSNLNLNGAHHPGCDRQWSEWGPQPRYPTPARRSGMRWFAIGGVVVILAVVVTYGYFMYTRPAGAELGLEGQPDGQR